jgi:hypothetical protein
VASAYRPGVYPGKITLFWATEELYRSTKWPKVTGIKDPEVHVVPGTHLIITHEHVLAVAEHLGTCLSKVQATAAS